MNSDMNNQSTLTILTVFAVAMANLEAAVVVYMRQLYYASNPREIFPLQFLNSYDTVLELSREAATVAASPDFLRGQFGSASGELNATFPRPFANARPAID